MLDLWQDDAAISQRPDPREGRDLPATLGETFQDAWSNGQLVDSGIKQENARAQAVDEYVDQIRNAGGNFDSTYAKYVTPEYQPDPFDVAQEVVAAMRAKGGDLPVRPMTEADIDQRAVEISRAAGVAHAEMGAREQGWGNWIGGFLGSTASQAVDPYNIPMMAIPLEGLGVLGTAAAIGGGMAATQMAREAANAKFNEQVQPDYFTSGQPEANVAEAGLGGALLGGGGRLLGKGIGAIAGKFMGTAERDAVNIAGSEANIQATNVLPGVEGEAAHPAALGKAIDDVLKERPVDVSQQVGAIEPERPPSLISELHDIPPGDLDKRITNTPAEPAVQEPGRAAEQLAQPEVHDAVRADIERTIDERAKLGQSLQIPVALDANGEPVFIGAARALGEIDNYKALAEQIAQCALPAAKQAAE